MSNYHFRYVNLPLLDRRETFLKRILEMAKMHFEQLDVDTLNYTMKYGTLTIPTRDIV